MMRAQNQPMALAEVAQAFQASTKVVGRHFRSVTIKHLAAGVFIAPRQK